ncbi:TIGR01777 family protein [Anaerobacillus alkalilacustris]|uniref:TIGR01777 family protein n=1 Tax=Anaerobacillus alkalilacustris TaxID=393763 RepID=A0A1S2LXN5_9BACI|nr:TIGR01777 family oxidoreductase [Anaerobacillus alkalilacustris]OIJ17278.1 TIGR01777 family protein [Anaerobacillus alkalilacustris]
MKIVIAGGTGLIGAHLVKKLAHEGHHIYILTRNVQNKKTNMNTTYVKWLSKDSKTEQQLTDIDVFINLAGETINRRWTKKHKERILHSRIEATRKCISLMKTLNRLPKVFLNASAIGLYGTSLTDTFTENNQLVGDDFLSSVVQKWEKEALKAELLGVRTVLLRFGVVLAKEGGALTKMLLPYQLLIGGTIGSGRQWVSWIHIDDAVNMIYFAINNENINGALNITGPEPIQMSSFGKAIGTTLQKPHWLPVPSFLLKILLGEMSTLVLDGQKVLPNKSMNQGYQFTYSNINDALKNFTLD